MFRTDQQDPEGLRIVARTPGYSLGELNRCLLMVWREQPTAAAFDIRHAELVTLAQRHPGRCGYLEVIERSSRPPTDDLRKIAVQAFRNLGKNLSCVGFTMDGPEIRTALVRAILTGMTFLVTQMQPSKVFKNVGDMARWTQARIDEPDPTLPERIVASFELLRRTTTT